MLLAFLEQRLTNNPAEFTLQIFDRSISKSLRRKKCTSTKKMGLKYHLVVREKRRQQGSIINYVKEYGFCKMKHELSVINMKDLNPTKSNFRW